MSSLQNPAKINRLWKKINDRFGPDDEEDEKKLTGKAKDAAKQRKKVDKGLNVLKILAKGGVKTPGKVKKFESNRSKLLKGLKKYCKLLKGGKIEGIQDQTKYRKSVLQLTVVIEELSPNQVTDEEGDEDINALLGIQTDKVESSLDDPALDTEEDEDFDAVEEEGEEKEGEETTPSGETKEEPEPEDLAASFKQRLQALTPGYQQALKAGAANKGQLEMAMKMALAAAKSQDFEQGMTQLDKLEAELSKTAPAKTKSAPDLAAEFKAKLAEWSPAIKTAMAAKGPDAAAIAKLLAQATALSKPGGDMAKALESLTECHALATGGASGTETPAEEKEGEEAEGETKEETKGEAKQTTPEANGVAPALAGWQSAREKAIGSLRQLSSAIAKANDPEGKQALLEVNAIIKNLTARPDTLQSVAELERYLTTDDIINHAEEPNGWGITVELEKPLMDALNSLKQALGSKK